MVAEFPIASCGSVWARSWDSSGLAAALTGAQGLVQQVLGDLCDTWHWDDLWDTTSSAGLGARGSRQTFQMVGCPIKGLSFSGISQGGDSTALAALGTSQELSAVQQVHPRAWRSQRCCAVPGKFPQWFGEWMPTSAPSAGSVPWLQHQNSGQDHSCPGAMLFSLFQKTKRRSPEGFI